MPEGWSTFTALDGQVQQGSRVSWAVTDHETLVDSPIFAGKYARQWTIGENVRLDAVADAPKYLELAPENLARFERLVAEADALFGARHFDHYDLLLARSEEHTSELQSLMRLSYAGLCLKKKKYTLQYT